MKILDVTLTLHEGMPLWPGDEALVLRKAASIEAGDGVNITSLHMCAHTGTHVDAPFHFVANGSTVDQMELEVLVGETLVVEVPAGVKVIDADVIASLPIAAGTERLLFKTSNSDLWEQKSGEFQPAFVGVDLSAAKELIRRGIKLCGIDYLSIAPFNASEPTHVALLTAGIIVVEGLDLRAVNPGVYNMICLPLKLLGADGAPARVILTRD